MLASSLSIPRVQSESRQANRYLILIVMLLMLSTLATFAYATLSIYIAIQLVYAPQVPLHTTPAALGMQYRDITFLSRGDAFQLRGWFIPGVDSHGKLTVRRTIIMVHGARENRAEEPHGILTLAAALARRGFAILSFDMRGHGESPAAPFSLGYFEQRDVLGAVDFLRAGPLPYPTLGRPQAIGGWGISMGASTLLLAAVHESAIRAIVSDCAFADALPLLEREIPKSGHLPQVMTPGALLAAQTLYGIDFYHIRPVDVVAQLAPRPLLFIHGLEDHSTPISNMTALANAARTGVNSHVQTLPVAHAGHAQSFHTLKEEYVSRVVVFYIMALGAVQ